VLKDRGPNDLEWIIEKLRKQNYALEMKIEMLENDILFLRKELQNNKKKYVKSNN
jgi:predicted RNase H-like nuclease (RuvC/YqgF family)